MYDYLESYVDCSTTVCFTQGLQLFLQRAYFISHHSVTSAESQLRSIACKSCNTCIPWMYEVLYYLLRSIQHPIPLLSPEHWAIPPIKSWYLRFLKRIGRIISMSDAVDNFKSHFSSKLNKMESEMLKTRNIFVSKTIPYTSLQIVVCNSIWYAITRIGQPFSVMRVLTWWPDDP
jgi:hypothetical protein